LAFSEARVREVQLSRVAYASISEIMIVAPPVAKFGMSADAACPSGEDMPLCNRSMSSKYPPKVR
jgi:hypothetical protein